MKKFIMSFAVIAFLIGGLTVNANAQSLKKSSSSKAKKENVNAKKEQTKKVDWEKTLKDYEKAVDDCLNLYQAMNAKDSKGKTVDPKEFNTKLAKAEGLRSKLENGLKNLNRSQTSRFNSATQKLTKVYEKN